MTGLNIRHVAAGLSKADGGPAYSVPRLVEELRSEGHEVLIRTLEPVAAQDLSDIARRQSPAVHTRQSGPPGRLFGASPDMASALRKDALECDIIHTHGLWLLPDIYPARMTRKREATAKLVHSIRGMLGPQAMQYSKWKKKVVWMLMQQRALAESHCLHATAASELDEIRAAGLTNPVAVIPNGIDIPDLNLYPRAVGGTRTILSLGRLHRKKGLDKLLLAWADLESRRPEWNLRIVGPAEEGHDIELRHLAEKLGLSNVSIEGPLYGNDVVQAYRDADLFILPTSNENFAMTVAESLAAGVPVISTRGAPWSGLIDKNCGWWIDNTVEAISGQLAEATTLPSVTLEEMGRRGREWMKQDFGWNGIAREMIAVYEWLALDGAPPASVVFD